VRSDTTDSNARSSLCHTTWDFPRASASDEHKLTIYSTIQAYRQHLSQPIHPSISTFPRDPQHNSRRLPRLHRRSQPSLHLSSTPTGHQFCRLDHADVPRHARRAIRRNGLTSQFRSVLSSHLVHAHERLPQSFVTRMSSIRQVCTSLYQRRKR
jgi:hypothetical protein